MKEHADNSLWEIAKLLIEPEPEKRKLARAIADIKPERRKLGKARKIRKTK